MVYNEMKELHIFCDISKNKLRQNYIETVLPSVDASVHSLTNKTRFFCLIADLNKNKHKLMKDILVQLITIRLMLSPNI